MPAEFVVPGQNRVSAALDVARTVVRRAERLAVTGSSPAPDSHVGPYLNRLSATCCGRWRAGRRVSISCRARLRPRTPAGASQGTESEKGKRTSMSPDLPVDSLRPPRRGVGRHRRHRLPWPTRRDRSVAVVAVPVLEAADGPSVAPGVPAVGGRERGRPCGRHLASTRRPPPSAASQARSARPWPSWAPPVPKGRSAHRPRPSCSWAGPRRPGPARRDRRAAACRCRRGPGRGQVRSGGHGGPGVGHHHRRRRRRRRRRLRRGAAGCGAGRGRGRRPRRLPVRGAQERREAAGIERVVVAGVGLDAAALAEGTRRGRSVADAVCLARDLINEPPSSLTPTRFADIAGRARRWAPRAERRGLGRAAHRRRTPRRPAGRGPGLGRAAPAAQGHLRAALTPSRSMAGCRTWCSWARASPSTPAGCRSSRPTAW